MVLKVLTLVIGNIKIIILLFSGSESKLIIFLKQKKNLGIKLIPKKDFLLYLDLEISELLKIL